MQADPQGNDAALGKREEGIRGVVESAARAVRRLQDRWPKCRCSMGVAGVGTTAGGV
jgi:hypothetical protein